MSTSLCNKAQCCVLFSPLFAKMSFFQLSFIRRRRGCARAKNLRPRHARLNCHPILPFRSERKTSLVELDAKKCQHLRVTGTGRRAPQSLSYTFVQMTRHVISALVLRSMDHSNRVCTFFGYLRRNFSKAPPSLQLVVQQTFIRPKLEYPGLVRDPRHDTLPRNGTRNSVHFILFNLTLIAVLA